MKKRDLALSLALVLGVLSAPTPPAAAAARAAVPRAAKPATWAEVERLIDDGLLREAVSRIEEWKRAPGARSDGAAWTRALLTEGGLHVALGEYKAAIRGLRSGPRPSGEVERAVLDIFYAQALTLYYRSDSWEINRREPHEPVEPGRLREPVSDPATGVEEWTRDELREAAVAAFLDAWKERQALGALPVDGPASYFVPNSYPREVRGTLRDALSYLFVELLADSSLWPVHDSEESERPDLALLLPGEPGVTAAALAVPTAQPLLQISAVLADLEAWHRSQGESGRPAVLEAVLERAVRLRQSFTDPDAAPNERMRPLVLRRQLEGVVRMTQGEAHSLATLEDALEVQTVVEAILDA